MNRWIRRSLCAVVLLAGAAIASWPMVPPGVPNHLMSDMGNHVRHVEEYRLALVEGQLPPLVAPALNGATRVPLFQYYGGTAYTVPGLLARAGLTPYRALGATIFLHVLAGGAFTYLTARALGARPAVAVLAGVALQTFPFAGPDLYTRGGYTEFIAIYAFPPVFYPMLRAVQAAGGGGGGGAGSSGAGGGDIAPSRRAAWRYACLAGLAWAYFIPLHPLHTAMLAALSLALLAAHALLDRRAGGGWTALLAPAASLALGAATTAWFWYPVVRDRAALRISAHVGFYDAGLADLGVLLSPLFRKAAGYDWAPQIGVPFVLGALLALLFARRTRAVGVLSALAVFGVIFVIGWHERFPGLERLLGPLQWSYRLLVPAAVAGSLCLALGVEALCAWLRRPLAEGAVLGAATAYALTLAPAYFARDDERQPPLAVERLMDPGFTAPNSYSYALRGTDLRDLNWADPDGTLRVGADLPVPREGYPLDVRLVLRPVAAADAAAAAAAGGGGGGEVTVLLDGKPGPAVARAVAGEPVALDFRLTPVVARAPGHSAVRFDVAPPGARWRVEDLAVRADGDPPGEYFRLPPAYRARQDGKRTFFTVDVPPGRAGAYQLPVCHLPSNRIEVNGAPVAGPASADRFMTVVRLPAGRNVVQVRTRPTEPARGLSLAAVAVLLCGCAAPPPWRSRRPPAEASAAPSPVPSPLLPSPATVDGGGPGGVEQGRGAAAAAPAVPPVAGP